MRVGLGIQSVSGLRLKISDRIIRAEAQIGIPFHALPKGHTTIVARAVSERAADETPTTLIIVGNTTGKHEHLWT